jgi:AraC family transcriptional regulator
MKEAINSSVNFIEEKISEKSADDLNIDELAERMHFSRTHYQRLFHAIMGEPVMEYIRKRKLQQACTALRESRDTILAIALNHGYASHEGFTRAFKAHFGVTPMQYRKGQNGKIKLYPEEVMNMNARQNIVKYANDFVKDLEALIDRLDTCAEPAERECSKMGINAAGISISLEEIRNLLGRMKNAKKEILEIFDEETCSAFWPGWNGLVWVNTGFLSHPLFRNSRRFAKKKTNASLPL